MQVIVLDTDDLSARDLSKLGSTSRQTRAKLVAMRCVLYNYGTMMLVAEVTKISHEHGAYFFLDISQKSEAFLWMLQRLIVIPGRIAGK